MGILPIVVLLLAIPGGLLLTLIGARRFLFRNGMSTFVKEGFTSWLTDQKERTQAEVKLEQRLSTLTEQLTLIIAANLDTRRYIDTVLDEMRTEHKTIMAKLDTLIDFLPRRKNDVS